MLQTGSIKKKFAEVKFHCWQDKNFMAALTKDALAIKKRKQKTYSFEEVKKSIDIIRKK